MAECSKEKIPEDWIHGYEEESDGYCSLETGETHVEEYRSLESEERPCLTYEVKTNTNTVHSFCKVSKENTSENTQNFPSVKESKAYRVRQTGEEKSSTNKETVLFIDIDNKANMVTNNIAKTISKSHEQFVVLIFYGEGFADKNLQDLLLRLKPCIAESIPSGKEKNSADFVLLVKIAQCHKQYPPETQFVIFSGDRAFEAILPYLPNRSVRVVSPHCRYDYNQQNIENAIFAPAEADRVLESTELQKRVASIKEDSAGHERVTFVYSSKGVVLDQNWFTGQVYPLLFYNAQRAEHLQVETSQMFETKHGHQDSVAFMQLLVAGLLHHELPLKVSFQVMSPYTGLEEIKPHFKDREVTITELKYNTTNPVKRVRERKKKKVKPK